MANLEMVDTYLRRLVTERFSEGVTVHDEGYQLPTDEQPIVGVIPGDGPFLRITATTTVAEGLVDTSQLLAAVNDINDRTPFVRLATQGGRVTAVWDTPGDLLTGEVLEHGINAVCWAVRNYGPGLVEAFGGTTAALPQPTLPFHDLEQPQVADLVRDEPVTAQADRTPVVVNAAGYL